MLYTFLAVVLYTLSALGQPTRTFEPWLTSTTYRIPVMATGEPLSEHTRAVLERGTVVTLLPSNLGPNPTASMIVLPPRDADSSVTGSALERRIDQIPTIPSNAGSNPTGPLLKPGPLHRDVFPSITASVLERRTEVVTLIPTPSNLSPNPGIVLIRPPREVSPMDFSSLTVALPTVTLPTLPIPTLPIPSLPIPSLPLPTLPLPILPIPTAPPPLEQSTTASAIHDSNSASESGISTISATSVHTNTSTTSIHSSSTTTSALSGTSTLSAPTTFYTSYIPRPSNWYVTGSFYEYTTRSYPKV